MFAIRVANGLLDPLGRIQGPIRPRPHLEEVSGELRARALPNGAKHV